jgi:signal transduction histidine kinase
MLEFFQKLFTSNDFMPHGHCYLWQPSIVWLHVVSDAIIVLAYYSIPLMLIYFVHKRRDIPFTWMFVMFGAFIFGCGTTHLLSIWTVWVPAYRFEGMVKLVTSLISIATAALLLPLIPKALELPSIQLSNERLKKSSADLARSNKDLEQFAYVASHDLQEPLRMVNGFVQLLQQRYKGKLDAQAEEYIQQAVAGTQRMHAMIEDLLAYSRVSSQNAAITPISSSKALEQAIANLQAAIKETGATVRSGVLPEIGFDHSQLVQVFQNLIGNALKFKGKDPLTIEVAAQKAEHEWFFSVKDNGIGIDPHYSEQIFEIFKRLHSKEKYPGSGIGLTICKRIVERHGGRIWVESSEGKGAAFYFTVPAREGN